MSRKYGTSAAVSYASFPREAPTNTQVAPSLPPRAVRPVRWTNSFGEEGQSKWMTVFTAGMSRPRAATSVTTSTGTRLFWNCERFSLRLVVYGKETG